MADSRSRTGGPFAWTAWAVHAYTASGAVLALLAVNALFAGNFRGAFVWLYIAVVIDSSDGALARKLRVHDRTPHFSGQRLDDLVDYLTFVFVPALIVWRADLVPLGWELGVVSAMLLSSAYGFARDDAKTDDGFFTGFPSYWNIAALYLFIVGLPAALNAVILLTLSGLVFVRVRYVYPSCTPTLRPLTLTLTVLWGVVIFAMIVSLPAPPRLLIWLSFVFPVYYLILSLTLDAKRRRKDPGRRVAF
jgi:phosphatidylcholine synthase